MFFSLLCDAFIRNQFIAFFALQTQTNNIHKLTVTSYTESVLWLHSENEGLPAPSVHQHTKVNLFSSLHSCQSFCIEKVCCTLLNEQSLVALLNSQSGCNIVRSIIYSESLHCCKQQTIIR